MIADTTFLVHWLRETRTLRIGPARRFIARHRLEVVRTTIISLPRWQFHSQRLREPGNILDAGVFIGCMTALPRGPLILTGEWPRGWEKMIIGSPASASITASPSLAWTAPSTACVDYADCPTETPTRPPLHSTTDSRTRTATGTRSSSLRRLAQLAKAGEKG